MAGLEITITDAGRAEIINAQNTGTDPVTISEIGVGSGQYTPDPTQTALQNEIKRLTTFSGDVVADDTIHVSIRDEGTDAYQVYEFGLYLASGTLLAVYSQTGSPILDKAATTILLLAVDIMLTTLDATSVTFGSTDFINPPATKTTAGVIELADEPEIKALTAPNRAITPETLGLLAAAEDQRGISRFGTTNESKLGQSGAIAASLKNVHEAFKQFGLGYWTPVASADATVKSGMYSLPLSLGATGAPIPDTSGSLLVMNGGADADYITQMWIEANDTDNKRMFFRHRKGASGGWAPWTEVWHSGNLVKTASETDTTAGRMLKAGDVNAVGRVDYRTPLSGGGITLAGNQQYHIVDSLNYSLPDTTGLTPGASVIVSKSIYAAPTILTFSTEQIATDAGTASSIELSEDTEAVFIWNSTNWEMVAGDAAAGFSQLFSDNGYQMLPSGLIIQWALFVVQPNTVTAFNLPLVFPNAAFNVIASSSATTGSDGQENFASARAISNGQVEVRNYYNHSAMPIFVQAIGN